MKLLINGEPFNVKHHTCGDPRWHYCVAVLNASNQLVSVHTLPKAWPYGSTGKFITGGNTYEWDRGVA